VATRPGPAGRPLLPATYVIYHVTVNMMYHVIIGMDAAGGTSGHGAQRRRADADRVGLAGRAAARGTGPGQADGDVYLAFACCDDDQDGAG